MLQSIAVLPDLIILTLRRLRSHLGLTFLALLGIVLAVGLLSSTAFFTQAVDRVILSQELAELSRVTGRHPFATRIYFFPNSRKPLSLSASEKAAVNIADTFSSEIGLPVGRQELHVESPGLMLLPSPDDTRYDQSDNSFLASTSLIYVADIAPQMEILAGNSFDQVAADTGDILPVWMHTKMAEEMGVRDGETFQIAVNMRQTPQLLRVEGLWQASAPDDPFWFSDPDVSLESTLVVRRADYQKYAEPMLAAKAGVVSWFITLDDSRLNPANAQAYAAGYDRGMIIIDRYVPGAKLDISALDPLTDFVIRQQSLTQILLSFNIPALGFLLAFLVLVSIIVAEWQRRETAILISRGMGQSSIVTLVLIEECLLFVVGVPLGIFCGMWLARAMGYTESFLTFTQREILPVSLQGLNIWLLLLALGVSLAARLLPALYASRESVVVQARDYARPIRPPWWQRAYLDILLIFPTYYAYQQLEQRGTLLNTTLQSTEGAAEELLQDPLLILMPALFVFAAALLSMRVFTVLTRLLDSVASWTPWTTPNLALRQLSRQGQRYINPLLLVTVSLALGIYTYTLAASLDQWLEDRVYYQAGSDLSFLPYMEIEGQAELDPSLMPTIDEYRDIPGVLAATRVGRYRTGLPRAQGRDIRGEFIAVDRADFPTVAWFRPDLAPESLGGLMNRLAIAPENILVSQRYFTQNQLNIGDALKLKVSLEDGISVTSDFKIAGVYKHFPTVQEKEEAVIGNLDYLFLLGGSVFEHGIWMDISPEVAAQIDIHPQRTAFFKLIERTGVLPILYRHAPTMIATEQAKFERVGIFGTLSVGFLAATAMAILALLIYSYASLQDRLYQFGVLRAVGLEQRQVLGQVIIEYGVLILYGALSGLIIGTTVAQLFVPFLRTAGREGVPMPPLLPIIAQDEIIRLALVFAAIMIVVEVIVVARALAGRLFDTLRMGHQG